MCDDEEAMEVVYEPSRFQPSDVALAFAEAGWAFFESLRTSLCCHVKYRMERTAREDAADSIRTDADLLNHLTDKEQP